MDNSIIQGFSKYNKQERIDALIQKYGFDSDFQHWLKSCEVSDQSVQKVIDELSENPISCFPFPFSVVPNFVVNGKNLFFPFGFRRKFGGCCFGKCSWLLGKARRFSC